MKMLKKEITKYYKWGSPNVTLNNMATIVDGIASGFDGSHYIKTSDTFQPSNKPWESVIKIKFTNDNSAHQFFFCTGYTGSESNYRIACARMQGGKVRMLMSSNGRSWDIAGVSSDSTLTLGLNTWYYVRFKFTGAQYICDVSLDNKTWSNYITVNSTTPIYNYSNNIVYGINAYTPSATSVNIDFNETYTSIDGTRLDNKQDVGAWVDEGVARGFSTSSYGVVPNYCKTTNGTYVFKFKTGSDITTEQYIQHSEFLFTTCVFNGKLVTWNFGTQKNINVVTVSANTTYWIKIVINGTTKTFYTSTDGNTWVQRLTFTDTGMNPSNTSYEFRLGLASHQKVFPFYGTIDLKECYLEQYNSKFWTGLKIVEGTKSDYKFTEQKPVYYACKTGNKYYALGE